MNKLRLLLIYGVPFVLILLLSLQAYAVDLAGLTLKGLDGKPYPETSLRKPLLLVVVAAGSKCPVMRRYIPKLNLLATKWKKKNIGFLLLDASKHDSFEDFRREFRTYKVVFPAVLDSDQTLASRIAFKTTSETAVIDTRTGNVLYQGAIDDQNTVDGRRTNSSKHDFLDNALSDASEGKPVSQPSANAFGCAITY